MRTGNLLAACALCFVLAACGGGATSTSSLPAVPIDQAPPGAAGPAPAPSPSATAQPISGVSPTPTPAPPPATSTSSRIPSTVGRVGLLQVFDYENGRMPQSTIQAYASRDDAVWGSVEPAVWKNAHPSMVVSNYFIMGFDRYSLMHHTLAWWQSNHPDWMLYACKADGSPTHDIAYMPGIGVPDMPIDIHNTAAVDYQIASMAASAAANGYNALAIDQVVFWNTLRGGNPSMGQKVDRSEYGCGVWQGSRFVRRYAAPTDHQWTTDVVNYVREAHALLRERGMSLVVNHPAGRISNPDEQQLLQNTDEVLDETGFTDYGRYAKGGGSFEETLSYMRYAQQSGTVFLDVERFAGEAQVDRDGFEYALAAYLLGNQGAALLFVGGEHGYGTEQYHPEYAAPIGKPCTDAGNSGSVYSRRFSGALVVLNDAGGAQSYALPAGKSFRDIENRSISSPLRLRPHDAYVLLSNGGC